MYDREVVRTQSLGRGLEGFECHLPEIGHVKSWIRGPQASGIHRLLGADGYRIHWQSEVRCCVDGVALFADETVRFTVHPDNAEWTVPDRIHGAADVISDLKAGKGLLAVNGVDRPNGVLRGQVKDPIIRAAPLKKPCFKKQVQGACPVIKFGMHNISL